MKSGPRLLAALLLSSCAVPGETTRQIAPLVDLQPIRVLRLHGRAPADGGLSVWARVKPRPVGGACESEDLTAFWIAAARTPGAYVLDVPLLATPRATSIPGASRCVFEPYEIELTFASPGALAADLEARDAPDLLITSHGLGGPSLAAVSSIVCKGSAVGPQGLLCRVGVGPAPGRFVDRATLALPVEMSRGPASYTEGTPVYDVVDHTLDLAEHDAFCEAISCAPSACDAHGACSPSGCEPIRDCEAASRSTFARPAPIAIGPGARGAPFQARSEISVPEGGTARLAEVTVDVDLFGHTHGLTLRLEHGGRIYDLLGPSSTWAPVAGGFDEVWYQVAVGTTDLDTAGPWTLHASNDSIFDGAIRGWTLDLYR